MIEAAEVVSAEMVIGSARNPVAVTQIFHGGSSVTGAVKESQMAPVEAEIVKDREEGEVCISLYPVSHAEQNLAKIS